MMQKIDTLFKKVQAKFLYFVYEGRLSPQPVSLTAKAIKRNKIASIICLPFLLYMTYGLPIFASNETGSWQNLIMGKTHKEFSANVDEYKAVRQALRKMDALER